MVPVKQRDIVWVDFEPVVGREQGGRRPAVVISGDALNVVGNIAIVCPLSGVVKNFAMCPILRADKSSGLEKESEVLVFQIKTISQKRIHGNIGSITENELDEVILGVNAYLKF